MLIQLHGLLIPYCSGRYAAARQPGRSRARFPRSQPRDGFTQIVRNRSNEYRSATTAAPLRAIWARRAGVREQVDAPARQASLSRPYAPSWRKSDFHSIALLA